MLLFPTQAWVQVCASRNSLFFCAVQVVAVLMSFYSRAMPELEDKARFFELLCRDFGTQRALSATHLCCAASAVTIQSCRAAVTFCTA